MDQNKKDVEFIPVQIKKLTLPIIGKIDLKDLPILGIIIVQDGAQIRTIEESPDSSIQISKRISNDNESLSPTKAYEMIFNEVESDKKKITRKLYNLRTYHRLEFIPGTRPIRYAKKHIINFLNGEVK